MKLQKGDKITEINLPSIDGKNFSFNKIKGKKTLLTFYRFATCPFCNLRIHEIINRYEELGKNFEMVAIFSSTKEHLSKNKYRSVSDFISGMTDRYAINLYNDIK